MQRPKHTDTPCDATTDCPCASCLPSAFRHFRGYRGIGLPNWLVARRLGIARRYFPLQLQVPRLLLDQLRVLCPTSDSVRYCRTLFADFFQAFIEQLDLVFERIYLLLRPLCRLSKYTQDAVLHQILNFCAAYHTDFPFTRISAFAYPLERGTVLLPHTSRDPHAAFRKDHVPGFMNFGFAFPG